MEDKSKLENKAMKGQDATKTSNADGAKAAERARYEANRSRKPSGNKAHSNFGGDPNRKA